MVCILHGYYYNHPPMRFSLTPQIPPAKNPHIITSQANSKNNNNGSDESRRYNSLKDNARTNLSTRKTVRKNFNNNMQSKTMNNEQQHKQQRNLISSNSITTEIANDKSEILDDYNQWLHAMKLVARLPGGMPPEFRRKLWLTLAEKYLKTRNADWEKEEKKCLSEEWREDDEELGIQIVKDLHRTGSNLCSGPAAKVNQARLKRVLLGYARYNPEVGYCQGFNMLGALILQVMDKEEIESLKVMIYLVEGILPPGYFCGSMGGLQADMGVFRELMQIKLPRLAKHLEKLQGPVETAYEPPLTNVFTMQWFLTLFCTCLPMTCVLRLWDLVLIEGSDVLLRSALVLWSLLEGRVLSTRSADDFYCRMGSFASELLNGHLIDSNSLIERIVQLGPIEDIEKLRNKHLYNITPLRHKSNLPLYFGEEEPENDEESRLAIATVWGIPWTRRGSQTTSSLKQVAVAENKDRLALDISLLKKQYDKLRERQKQAHIIITTACSTAKPDRIGTCKVSRSAVPASQLIMGKSAIVTNQGRRIAPPVGAIPPARKPSLPAVLQSRPTDKILRRGETLQWRDTDLNKRRRESLTWKEIKADRINQSKDEPRMLHSQKIHNRVGKSDSSSYSEESDEEEDDDHNSYDSSTDTSLCDDDPAVTAGKTQSSSIENSPQKRSKGPRRHRFSESKHMTSRKLPSSEDQKERTRPKSWAPSASEIPFMLLTSDSPTRDCQSVKPTACNDEKSQGYNETSINYLNDGKMQRQEWALGYSPIAGDLASRNTIEPLNIQTEMLEMPANMTSPSQLSLMPDIASYLEDTTISPLPTPKQFLLASTNSLGSGDGDEALKFDVNDDGVTNQYFERVNSVERLSKLELSYALKKENNSSGRNREIENENYFQNSYRPDLLIDHPQKFIAITSEFQPDTDNESRNRLVYLGERDDNIPGENVNDFRENTHDTTEQGDNFKPYQIKPTTSHLDRATKKRCDPRRLTLTTSSAIEIDEHFRASKKHVNQDIHVRNYHTSRSEELSSGYDTTNPEVLHETLTDEFSFDLKRRRGNLRKSSQEKIQYCSMEEDVFMLSTGSHIPSANDLEERYQRQMSASDKSRSDSVDIGRCATPNCGDEGGDGKETNNRKENIKRSTKDSKQTNEITETGQQKEKESDENNGSKNIRPIPKTTPSTADLEERFDALEIEKEKSISSESKKEPPDIADQIPEHQVDVKREKDYIDKEEQNLETEGEYNFESIKKKTPPSTEELEKRFHALEKQMSLSAPTQKDTSKFKEVKKGQEMRREQPENDKGVNEGNHEHEKAALKIKTTGRRASEPPSTEDLERRYETLKRRMSSRIETIDEALQRIEKSMITDDSEAVSINMMESRTKQGMETTRVISPKKFTSQEQFGFEDRVPIAPPMPPPKNETQSLVNVSVTKERTALIEELQSKIDMNAEGTLKPSSINPNRKPHPTETKPSFKKYVTSETHALTAFLQSGNYEPRHDYAGKMVRRFSDLPSRADLENRLEYLEQIFYRDMLKQRCASDSEVASRKRFVNNDDQASCSRVEQRLQALEKQLSENSLKLLDSMNSTAKECSMEVESPRRLSKDTIDATGKELVRFKNVGEFEEFDALKPINISINIKMLVDKNAEGTSELERRLEALEIRVKSSKNVLVDGSNEDEERQEVVGNEKYYEIEKNLKCTVEQEGENSLEKTRAIQNTEENLELKHLMKKKALVDVKTKETQKDLNQSVVDSNGRGSEDRLQVNGPLILEKTLLEEMMEVELKERAIDQQQDITLHSEKELSKKESSKPVHDLHEKICVNKDEEIKESKNTRAEIGETVNEIECSKCSPTPKEVLDYSEENKEAQRKGSSKKTNEATNYKEAERRDIEVEAGNVSIIQKIPDSPKTESKQRSYENRQAESCNSAMGIIKGSVKEPLKTNEKSSCDRKSDEAQEQACKNYKGNVESPETEKTENIASESLQEKEVVNASEISSVDTNKKTMILLLNNEPKAVKVRRLTRANTEELEGLFQALEKQLQDRNLVKSNDGTLKHVDIEVENKPKDPTEEAHAISELTKEIEEFTAEEKRESNKKAKKDKLEEEEPYDWGPDLVKRHLKRKTAHLPSTKELEARFRSLERQIKLLEDVEKIDVEQRLHEIERKIKLQHSLANETDLTKYLELCESKGLDDDPSCLQTTFTKADNESRCECGHRTPSTTSPSRKSSQSPSRKVKTPSNSSTSPLDRSSRSKTVDQWKKHPIHPIEMLLDPSPEESKIPTTGELEHRIRILEDKCRSPARSSSKSRSKSPIVRIRTPSEERGVKKTFHKYPTYEETPTKPEPPTAEELEARMRALEEDHIFDSKTQRHFKEFNDKLKNVISPSMSIEECKKESMRDSSPKRINESYQSPKFVRISEDENYFHTSSRSPCRESSFKDQKKSIVTEHGDERSSMPNATLASIASEGLDALGSRLMRETSPLKRTGTVTGVPLRTNDNIVERLSSIKDTIKSIDSLCEEKSYRKEKCQRYIDSLFSDSVHFAQKKTSLEELRSHSGSRTHHTDDYEPFRHVSDVQIQRPSDHHLGRSIGSAESIRTYNTSPLRAASPLHYRSNRDITRNTDVSPARRGRRYDAEEREEYESRVRRNNYDMLPNILYDSQTNLSIRGSRLTKFNKDDSQLESYERDNKSRSLTPSRSPVRSPYDANICTTTAGGASTNFTEPPSNSQSIKNFDLDKSNSPYCPTTHNNMLTSDYAKRLNISVYNPSKLDIRHTTVTSTFYDRLLTERQIEKTFCKSPTRSPVQPKNYLESSSIITTANKANDYFKSPSNSSSSYIHSSLYSRPVQTSLHDTVAMLETSAMNSYSTTTLATMATGNSDSRRFSQNMLCMPSPQNAEPIQNDFIIRSNDNILMQLNSNSLTTANLTTSTSTSTTLSSMMMPVITNANISSYSFMNINANQTTAPEISLASNITESNASEVSTKTIKTDLPNTTNFPSIPIARSTTDLKYLSLPSMPNQSIAPISISSTTTTGSHITPSIENASVLNRVSYSNFIDSAASTSLVSSNFQPFTIGIDAYSSSSATNPRNIAPASNLYSTKE